MLNNRQYCTFVAVIMIEKVIEYVEKYIIRLKLYWFMNFDRAVLMHCESSHKGRRQGFYCKIAPDMLY